MCPVYDQGTLSGGTAYFGFDISIWQILTFVITDQSKQKIDEIIARVQQDHHAINCSKDSRSAIKQFKAFKESDSKEDSLPYKLTQNDPFDRIYMCETSRKRDGIEILLKQLGKNGIKSQQQGVNKGIRAINCFRTQTTCLVGWERNIDSGWQNDRFESLLSTTKELTEGLWQQLTRTEDKKDVLFPSSKRPIIYRFSLLERAWNFNASAM